MESFVFISAIISAAAGFGIAYLIVTKLNAFESRETFRYLLIFSLGMGLTGQLNQFFINPLFGLSLDVDKAAKSFVVFILVLPAAILGVAALFGSAKPSTDESHKSPQIFDSTVQNSKPYVPRVNLRKHPDENATSKSVNVDEESLWAEALECYEKKREAGLYARLFAEKNGDEQKIKAEYLRIKFSQLKAEKIEGARRLLKEKSLSQKASQIQAIKTGAYELKKNRSSEYFLMWDGMVAIPSPKGNYGIYTSESLAIQSIDHFESYGEYKSKGLVFIITAEEYASYQVVFEAKKTTTRKKSIPDNNMVTRVPKR